MWMKQRLDLVLVIFTGSYPFDIAAEQTFLSREIPHLLDYFGRVVLVPKVCGGHRLEIPINVEVNEEYANFIKQNSNLIKLFYKAISSQNFYREIFSHPSILLFPAKLLKLVLFISRAELTREWVLEWIDANNIDINKSLFYSYWFDHIAMGLSLIKEKFPQIKVVSRAHGYDIYEELYFPYFWPCRRQSLDNIDKIFPASHNGRNYFRDRYPEFHDLFETAHLGVEEPGFVSKPSVDGTFRIVSCAHIFPLKRVDLLIKGIALAARKRSEQQFEWIHFGDGKQRKALQRLAKRLFPANAKWTLPGYVPNQEVMRHYRDYSVDVFVNLSTTEGGAPVAIQEAISCGIPVIATNVGGNPEIVSEQNGILLNPNPTPDEVARALFKISDNLQQTQQMRQESRRIWGKNYNAKVNFRGFAEKLLEIRRG